MVFYPESPWRPADTIRRRSDVEQCLIAQHLRLDVLRQQLPNALQEVTLKDNGAYLVGFVCCGAFSPVEAWSSEVLSKRCLCRNLQSGWVTELANVHTLTTACRFDAVSVIKKRTGESKSFSLVVASLPEDARQAFAAVVTAAAAAPPPPPAAATNATITLPQSPAQSSPPSPADRLPGFLPPNLLEALASVTLTAVASKAHVRKYSSLLGTAYEQLTLLLLGWLHAMLCVCKTSGFGYQRWMTHTLYGLGCHFLSYLRVLYGPELRLRLAILVEAQCQNALGVPNPGGSTHRCGLDDLVSAIADASSEVQLLAVAQKFTMASTRHIPGQRSHHQRQVVQISDLCLRVIYDRPTTQACSLMELIQL